MSPSAGCCSPARAELSAIAAGSRSGGVSRGGGSGVGAGGDSGSASGSGTGCGAGGAASASAARSAFLLEPHAEAGELALDVVDGPLSLLESVALRLGESELCRRLALACGGGCERRLELAFTPGESLLPLVGKPGRLDTRPGLSEPARQLAAHLAELSFACDDDLGALAQRPLQLLDSGERLLLADPRLVVPRAHAESVAAERPGRNRRGLSGASRR